ncbi:TolC family protein [Acinetobacter qingfengensis]|uniref:RND transporter n=1 Tax=Acinetobacter qingfengensis TaxID=1262585 RepID=A0A1E7RCJ6_9GAMM|nr:TolC family protein [Acinetobacter qingfengensis]KAA8735252.1 TolC family protein [Acinetobacter qingfengensis]OEY96972.1 RND transporter [Acinetobacter qingfengensis]
MFKHNAIWQHQRSLLGWSQAKYMLALSGLCFSSSLWANTFLSYENTLNKVTAYQQQANTFATQQQIGEARVKQSALWANPNLSISQTGFGSNQDRELDISVSQEIDIFGKRRALKQLSQLEQSQLEITQKIYQVEIELAVEYLWSQVALQQEELKLSQNQLATSQATIDATKLRYRAGSISKLDDDRAMVTHIENQRKTQQIELALTIAKKQLANLWGESASNFTVNFNQTIWPSDTAQFIETSKNNNLYQQNLALLQQQQHAQADYFKVANRPNPTVSLGMTRNQSAGVNGSDNQLMLGVEVPLNIFNRNQYSQQIISAKQTLLDQQKRFYQLQHGVQLETLLSEITGLKQQYDLMNDRQIPLSEEVYQKTLLGFKVGKYSITDVQQASVQLQEQRLNKIQLLKQAWQKSFEAKSLALGVDVNVIRSPDAIMQINQKLWQSTQEISTTVGVE